MKLREALVMGQFGLLLSLSLFGCRSSGPPQMTGAELRAALTDESYFWQSTAGYVHAFCEWRFNKDGTLVLLHGADRTLVRGAWEIEGEAAKLTIAVGNGPAWTGTIEEVSEDGATLDFDNGPLSHECDGSGLKRMRLLDKRFEGQ